MHLDVVDEGSFPLEVEYVSRSRRYYALTIALFVASAILGFFSILYIRYSGLTISVAFDVLMAHLRGSEYGNYYYDLLIWERSAPRAIVAVFAGAGLGVGGCVMQSLMRNPLADPYTTGVASGASFGAAIFIMLGISILPFSNYQLALTTNAILFALIPTIAIIAISKKKSITPTTMILAGVAIMYVFRASTSIMTLSADPEAVDLLYRWNVGSVGQTDWSNIPMIIIATTVCSVLLYFFSRDITIMTAGDKSARSMGVNTKISRAMCLAILAVLTAIIVGVTGTIGFMGLVAPHVARMFVGSNMKYLMPCSAACGAIILVCCDLLAKVIEMGIHSFPVGVITSIIGGPIFIILLIKGAKKVWY